MKQQQQKQQQQKQQQKQKQKQKQKQHQSRPKAAILAVGTEITDGQIVNRNSAWIAERLVQHRFEIIEHRVVADDHLRIENALQDFIDDHDINWVFITGGLGPTTDDFTREVIAKVFSRPLSFDQSLWEALTDKLQQRGVPVRESHKQQCYFPLGSEILFNQVGTAHGFYFSIDDSNIHVIALPGPPAEIRDIWDNNIDKKMSSLVPNTLREALIILRCLGAPESEVAEITESILGSKSGSDSASDSISDSAFRLGYRAHIPYVEVKIWYPGVSREQLHQHPKVMELKRQLSPWLVNFDHEDLADHLLLHDHKETLHILDFISHGLFTERMAQRLREIGQQPQLQQHHNLHIQLPITIQSNFNSVSSPTNWEAEWSKVQQEWDEKSSVNKKDTIMILFPTPKGVRVGIRKFVSKTNNYQWIIEDLESGLRFPRHSERSRKFYIEKALELYKRYS